MAAGGGSAARAAVPGLEALYRHLPSAVYKFNVRFSKGCRSEVGSAID
jgi:hypothetical protein